MLQDTPKVRKSEGGKSVGRPAKKARTDSDTANARRFGSLSPAMNHSTPLRKSGSLLDRPTNISRPVKFLKKYFYFSFIRCKYSRYSGPPQIINFSTRSLLGILSVSRIDPSVFGMQTVSDSFNFNFSGTQQKQLKQTLVKSQERQLIIKTFDELVVNILEMIFEIT